MIDPTWQRPQGEAYVAVKWVLKAGEVGSPVKVPRLRNLTVQIYGTFGGASAALKGALDPEDPQYQTIRSLADDIISVTSMCYHTLAQEAYLTQPVVTGGDGTTSITVVLGGCIL